MIINHCLLTKPLKYNARDDMYCFMNELLGSGEEVVVMVYIDEINSFHVKPLGVVGYAQHPPRFILPYSLLQI